MIKRQWMLSENKKTLRFDHLLGIFLSIPLDAINPLFHYEAAKIPQ